MADRHSNLLFLVVHKNKTNGVPESLDISENLEHAREAPHRKPKQKKTNSSVDQQAKTSASLSEFEELSRELSKTIRVYKSLDNVMTFLNVSEFFLQYTFAIRPQIRQHARQVYEAKDRNVYAFSRLDLPKFISAITEVTNGVMGGRQLPQLLIVGLVSEYDIFLQKLIRTGITAEIGILSRVERSLGLKDLAKFATIQEATDFLIDREIEAILYKDHFDQLLTVGDLFNAKVDMGDRCVTTFMEVCERRNLFTHNAGVVNSRYVKKCEEFGCKRSDVKIGERLIVNSKYYNEAVSTAHELCIKLCQFIWRKLRPNERNLADEHLNALAFELIARGDYSVAERLLDYGLHHTGKGEDRTLRMMVVNYANAIKLGGDRKRALSELDKLDWTATGDDFSISVAAVRDDVDEVIRLMPRGMKGGVVGAAEYREWPVFKSIRDDKKFQNAFQETFGEAIVPTIDLPIADTALIKKEVSAQPSRKRAVRNRARAAKGRKLAARVH